MITLVLHHAALELISNENCELNHTAIKNDASRRNKKADEILLDISVHQAAIRPDKLHFSGRPDLVHIFLIQYHHIMKLLPHNLSSKIQLYVHARTDDIFLVPQSWRIPVHFIRFRGLIEKFLVQKTIVLDEHEQLELKKGTLEELLAKLEPERVINLMEKGRMDSNFYDGLWNSITSIKNIVIFIGGYQKGEIPVSTLVSYPIEEIKLIETPTTAWMILNILFSGFIIENKEE